MGSPNYDSNAPKCDIFPSAIGMHWREGFPSGSLAAMELYRHSLMVLTRGRGATLSDFAFLASERGPKARYLHPRNGHRTLTIPFESLRERAAPVTADPYLEVSILELG